MITLDSFALVQIEKQNWSELKLPEYTSDELQHLFKKQVTY
jgi:hypothetical protein